MDTKSWKEIKDEVYGKKGSPHRDDRDWVFTIGLLLKKILEKKICPICPADLTKRSFY